MNLCGLAAEAAELCDNKGGFRVVKREIGGVGITDVRITPQAERRTGRAAGRYITLEGDPASQSMAGILRRAIQQVIPPQGRLFAAGLGNPDITQDSFGALSVRGIAAGKGRRYSLAAVETDVAARTGITAARLIRAAAGELRADCVIAVDALACDDPRRIGRTIQISDTGLVPGSGMAADSEEVCERTVGVRVAAVGVPTVVRLSSITSRREHGEYMVTAADIDAVVRLWADAVAAALNSLRFHA